VTSSTIRRVPAPWCSRAATARCPDRRAGSPAAASRTARTGVGAAPGAARHSRARGAPAPRRGAARRGAARAGGRCRGGGGRGRVVRGQHRGPHRPDDGDTGEARGEHGRPPLHACALLHAVQRRDAGCASPVPRLRAGSGRVRPL
jgi:hypothetical protein